MPSEAGHRRKFHSFRWHPAESYFCFGRCFTVSLSSLGYLSQCYEWRIQANIFFQSMSSEYYRIQNRISQLNRRMLWKQLGQRAFGKWKQLNVSTLTEVLNRGRHLSYQRGKRNTNPNTSLIQIEGVNDTNAAKYVETRESLDEAGY
jgi:hypothetical protein